MRACLLLMGCALLVGAAIATSGLPAQDNSSRGKQRRVDRGEFESQFPITEIDKPEPADPEKRNRRRGRGKRYDNAGIQIDENGDTITVDTEWDIGLEALPVDKSDVVLISEVTGVEAYVSDEKTAVFSEFTIRADEVHKNASSLALTRGSVLVADRQGGRVRFPSGHITLLFVKGQGMPRVGHRYALFLTYPVRWQGANILTGYELRDGRVFPLDARVGGQYRGAEEPGFLNDLLTAVRNAH